MRELVALQVLHSSGGEREDAIWGAAVLRGTDGVPVLQTFHGPRGGTLQLLPPKTREDLREGCAIVFSKLCAQKKKKGYKVVDADEAYYDVAAVLEAMAEERHGAIKSRGQGGSKPPATHEFAFGVSDNGEHVCRVCGRREHTEVHGYKPKPLPQAKPTPATAPKEPTRPVQPVAQPILRQRRKLDF